MSSSRWSEWAIMNKGTSAHALHPKKVIDMQKM